jgi:hypothetical protein
MKTFINRLWCDEAGFVVSAELILVATIGVLSLVVGLAEISHGINQELEDCRQRLDRWQLLQRRP